MLNLISMLCKIQWKRNPCLWTDVPFDDLENCFYIDLVQLDKETSIFVWECKLKC